MTSTPVNAGENPDKPQDVMMVSFYFKEHRIRKVMVPASSVFSISPPEDLIPIWEHVQCGCLKWDEPDSSMTCGCFREPGLVSLKKKGRLKEALQPIVA